MKQGLRARQAVAQARTGAQQARRAQHRSAHPSVAPSDVVAPRRITGMNFSLFQLFGRSPKFTVGCGACPALFVLRFRSGIDRPAARCAECGTWNELPLHWH